MIVAMKRESKRRSVLHSQQLMPLQIYQPLVRIRGTCMKKKKLKKFKRVSNIPTVTLFLMNSAGMMQGLMMTTVSSFPEDDEDLGITG